MSPLAERQLVDLLIEARDLIGRLAEHVDLALGHDPGTEGEDVDRQVQDFLTRLDEVVTP